MDLTQLQQQRPSFSCFGDAPIGSCKCYVGLKPYAQLDFTGQQFAAFLVQLLTLGNTFPFNKQH
ncbi:hypothetical protein D3C86_2235750 [compost metagenome]